MALYEFTCIQCNHITEDRVPTEMILKGEGHPPCQYCGAPTQRVYSPTATHVHLMADDVLNRAAQGKGDPCPGMSQEETQRAAKALAKAQRQKPKRQPNKKKVAPPKTFLRPDVVR